MVQTEQVSLVIFTCENREHLLQRSYDSFIGACSYRFSQVVLAIDGKVNPEVISYINPDLVIYNYQRKGYVNSINNALANVKGDHFFWLEDDWKFHTAIDIPYLSSLLSVNNDRAEIVFSKYGPLPAEFKAYPLGNDLYQTTFGFSANPCLCNTAHIKEAFNLLSISEKGGKLGVDGFENFLSRHFEETGTKCIIIDPVDHEAVSHEGYLESTPRNWHMTNSLDAKTKEHLLTIPTPSLARRLFMVLKLAAAFIRLAVTQLFSNKVYELCFRVIASAKTIQKDE